MTTPSSEPRPTRPAPVVALPDPWAEAALVADPVRLAAHHLARRSADTFAIRTAAKAADMLRRVLPGAATAIIEEDHDADCECHRWRLRLVRDRAAAVLWYEDPFDDHPDVVRRDELERAGGPVLPVLDVATREAIEDLVDTAQGWTPVLDSTDVTVTDVHDGQQVAMVYEGDFYLLDVDAVLARAAALPDTPVSIDLDSLRDILARESSVLADEDVAPLMDLVRTEATRLACAGRGVTTERAGATR
jgi:hypothetical protein